MSALLKLKKLYKTKRKTHGLSPCLLNQTKAEQMKTNDSRGINLEALSEAKQRKENECCNCHQIKNDDEFEKFGDSNDKTLCRECADKIMTADRS